MAEKSHIEWTDATWNPVTGCTKISPGCKNCYAEKFAERFRGVPGHPYEQGFDLRLWPNRLSVPASWKKPRRVFVNSMSDLFHEDVPDRLLAQVFQTMLDVPRHSFQLLTKRAERLADWHRDHPEFWYASNIWIGVSVEDRKFGVPRVDHLRKVAAAVRFLSIEPLLEDVGSLDLRGMDWVIVGGESGPGARPMREEWVRGVQAQCQAAGVAFFFKQWGGVRKKKAGRELGGRTWDEMPAASISADFVAI